MNKETAIRMASELNARQERLIADQKELITKYLKDNGNVFVVNGDTELDVDELLLTEEGMEKVTDECEIISAEPYMTAQDYYLIGMSWSEKYNVVNVYATNVDNVAEVTILRFEDVFINEYSKLIGLISNGEKIDL